MSLHYRSGCCGKQHQHTIQLSKTAEVKLDRLTRKYIRELFDEYQLSDATRTQMWAFYNNELTKGLKAGYSPKVEHYDKALAERLQQNIATFSAFKETNFRKTLEAELTKGGKLTPWSEFKKKADQVAGNYNKRWLKTEYDHTVANANAAAQWQKYEAQKAVYPCLKFNTIGDGAVRADHEELNGFIAKVDDSIWGSLTPPLDWGCRCYLTQTDEVPDTEAPNTKNVKKDFANNPAKTGEVFKNGGAYGKQLSKAEKVEAEAFAKKQRVRTNDLRILSMARSKQFIKINNNVYEHLLVKKIDDYKEIKETATLLCKNGGKAELLPEIEASLQKQRKVVFPKYINKNTNPDIRYNGKYYDLKRPESIRRILKNANKASSKQNCIAIISDSRLDKPLTDRIMENRAKHIFMSEEYNESIVIFKRGKEVTIFNKYGKLNSR